MTIPATPTEAAPRTAPALTGRRRSRRRFRRLTTRDILVLCLLVGVPLFLDLALIWGPTVASVLLSFTSWDGVERDQERRHPQLQHHLLGVPGVLAGGPAQPALAGLPRDRRHAGRIVLRDSARQADPVQPVLPEHALPAGGALAGGRRVHRPARLLPRLRRAQRHHRAHVQPDRLAGRSAPQHLGRTGRRRLAPRRVRDDPLSGRPESRRPGAQGVGVDRRRERVADVLPGHVPDAPAGQRRRAGDHRDRGSAGVRHRLRDQQRPQRSGTAVRPGDRQHHRRGEPDRVRVGARRRPAS